MPDENATHDETSAPREESPRDSGRGDSARNDALVNLSVEEKKALVMDALHTVLDPEIGLSVKELGLVRDLTIQDDRAHLVMILTTPFCPYAPQLLEMSRSKVQETLGVPTTIEVGAEYWDPSMAEAGVLDDWGLY